jgi:hypothetical protein
MKRFILVAVAAATVMGCADSTEPEAANAPEANGLSFYDCRGSFSEDVLAHAEVGIGEKTLTLTDLSKDAVPPDTGTVDTTFRPTPAFEGAHRYVGFPKIHEAFSGSEVANFEVVLSKDLVAKKPTGKLFVRTSGGSGGDSTSYFCRAKAAPLKVDTAKSARLACSLEKLVCVHDNPPGDTCLGDLFLNQTSREEATLRQTFLDHFGVNVQERKVPLGASQSLARTTSSLTGSWTGGVALNLEHRGGITYVGTYVHTDGKSQNVQCNDLAMLD